MKITKMAGALALTAALAMGTMPAFAASVSEDADSNAFSDSGSTEIKANVEKINKNVRATVPLTVTIAFGSDAGGNDFITPNADKYAITNIGEGDITLTEAKLKMVDGSPFTSAAFAVNPSTDNATHKYEYYDSDDGWMAFTDGNQMCFTISAGGVKTYLTEDHAFSAAGKKSNGTYGTDATAAELRYVSDATAWKDITIPHGTTGNTLPIQLGGAGWFKSAIDKDAVTGTSLCQITYTIAAAE